MHVLTISTLELVVAPQQLGMMHEQVTRASLTAMRPKRTVFSTPWKWFSTFGSCNFLNVWLESKYHFAYALSVCRDPTYVSMYMSHLWVFVWATAKLIALAIIWNPTITSTTPSLACIWITIPHLSLISCRWDGQSHHCTKTSQKTCSSLHSTLFLDLYNHVHWTICGPR